MYLCDVNHIIKRFKDEKVFISISCRRYVHIHSGSMYTKEKIG